MAIPVLRAKLHIPHTRPELVSRSRLIERLNEGLHLGRRLTLISAPAGYGKTTLLSEWLHPEDEELGGSSPAHVTLHPSRVAWLSLDEVDSDPARFWPIWQRRCSQWPVETRSQRSRRPNCQKPY